MMFGESIGLERLFITKEKTPNRLSDGSTFMNDDNNSQYSQIERFYLKYGIDWKDKYLGDSSFEN